MINQTEIIGKNSVLPYSDFLPVTAVSEGNTIRLAVSQGVPFQSEISFFKNVNEYGNNNASFTLYTAPQGKTFYVMSVFYSDDNGNPTLAAGNWQVQDANGVVLQQAGFAFNSPASFGFNSPFPIAIVGQGQSIVVNKSAGGINLLNFGISFIGYEIFGVVN